MRGYVVEVNETHIFAQGVATDWWVTFRYFAYEKSDRIRIVKSGLIGDVVHVACSNRKHAGWLAGFMHDQGVPRTAAKVRRAPAVAV